MEKITMVDINKPSVLQKAVNEALSSPDESVKKVVHLSRAEFDALPERDARTLYITTGDTSGGGGGGGGSGGGGNNGGGGGGDGFVNVLADFNDISTDMLYVIPNAIEDTVLAVELYEPLAAEVQSGDVVEVGLEIEVPHMTIAEINGTHVPTGTERHTVRFVLGDELDVKSILPNEPNLPQGDFKVMRSNMELVVYGQPNMFSQVSEYDIDRLVAIYLEHGEYDVGLLQEFVADPSAYISGYACIMQSARISFTLIYNKQAVVLNGVTFPKGFYIHRTQESADRIFDLYLYGDRTNPTTGYNESYYWYLQKPMEINVSANSFRIKQ